MTNSLVERWSDEDDDELVELDLDDDDDDDEDDDEDDDDDDDDDLDDDDDDATTTTTRTRRTTSSLGSWRSVELGQVLEGLGRAAGTVASYGARSRSDAGCPGLVRNAVGDVGQQQLFEHPLLVGIHAQGGELEREERVLTRVVQSLGVFRGRDGHPRHVHGRFS